jgi:hypothetical protein
MCKFAENREEKRFIKEKRMSKKIKGNGVKFLASFLCKKNLMYVTMDALLLGVCTDNNM